MEIKEHLDKVSLVVAMVALIVAITSGGTETIKEVVVGGTTNFDDLNLIDGLVVNDDGGSGTVSDTRIEGDTISNLFVVDASADKVGIASSTPTFQLSLHSSATTTLYIGSSSVTQGSCFQLHDTEGNPVRGFVTQGDTAMTFGLGRCDEN